MQSKRVNTKKLTLTIGICVAIVLGLILFDVLTPFGGNMKRYQAWIECGSRPYQEDGLPGGGVRFYTQSPVFAIFSGVVDKYYCTALDAERDGLSAASYQYQFPELEKQKQTIR